MLYRKHVVICRRFSYFILLLLHIDRDFECFIGNLTRRDRYRSKTRTGTEVLDRPFLVGSRYGRASI